MSKRIALMLATALISLNFSGPPALAGWGTFTMTDGNGDGVKYKHSLLGQKSMEAEDKLGDSYVRKRGLLGVNRESGASVLGNGFDVKHGLVSGKTFKAGDIFGDSIKSKKSFFGFGPRNTTVDVHGMGNIVHGYLHRTEPGMGYGGGGPTVASPPTTPAPADIAGSDTKLVSPQDYATP
jgi:hypothetical protein